MTMLFALRKAQVAVDEAWKTHDPIGETEAAILADIFSHLTSLAKRGRLDIAQKRAASRPLGAREKRAARREFFAHFGIG